MLEELKKVSRVIDDFIRKDDFPDKIEPEFLRLAVRDYPERGGKRLRPALLLWSCGLLGGDVKTAVPAAAAVEIFHNWTLVHDDIIDDDDVRRGQPTSHTAMARYAQEKYHLRGEAAAKFGRDFAILTGDLQQAWANNMMLKLAEHGVSAKLTLQLTRRMQEFVNRELISGEALDVEFPFIGASQLSEKQVARMLYMKTSVLLRFCTGTGAMIALDDPEGAAPEVKALEEYAAAAGVAFQYRDDWLGVYGDFKEFGKPICSDLAEAKPTLLLIKALEMLNKNGKRELESLIGLEYYGDTQTAAVRELISSSGAEIYVVNAAEKLIDDAARQLKKLPCNEYTRLLEQLLEYLVRRDK